ncbi:PhzF family phenazine biosynthesis protein [Cytobacillus purgationiresistens]|uniref:PhzF family phenazine biosynthesis protein n=1 Tax=Cytobacillus purgationiresistens TaxID=863449 RepID=A0ABU0AR00_9BACI|nr:PhzF family phenazine biosynthesis isomerase [Cytobacillus purgationiresistens]MDQ0273465.1 PhzF family phenazine biosynthesis protein [Cytobacillus purgationiresistens]
MAHQIFLINAFTREKFKGNPAAVILMSNKRSDDWMQSLANEINQPITAFVTQTEQNRYNLRWFTPIEEIDLCGHGTLGAAHILWSEGLTATTSPIIFETQSGTLQTERSAEQIILRFPIKQTKNIEVTDYLEAVVDSPIVNAAWAEDRYILELEDAKTIHNVTPCLEAIRKLDGPGVILTSRGSNQYDFVSRYFAPKIGINEDFVTGSAHCALASYWGKVLAKKQFTAFQDSARGGEIHLKIAGENVELIGDCLTLISGQMIN